MACQALIVTTTLITFIGANLALYLRHRHQTLRSQVTIRPISAAERNAAAASHGLESLPADLMDHPEDYRIFHTLDSLSLSPGLSAHLSIRPQQAANLFTSLMRRNMISFSTWLPQAYLLRLLAKTPEQKRSFSTSHIRTLDFNKGDLVCGVYRVLVRREMRCEMGMSMPAAGLPGSFGGRLVTSIVAASATNDGGGERLGEGGGLVLQTETLQWVKRNEAMVLPLERGLVRWMHALASWALLIAGAAWLEEEVLNHNNT